MQQVTVVPIAALKDNYIWVIIFQQMAIIVDPGDHSVVLDFLSKHQLTLAGILITHHHWDHTNGVLALKKQFNIPIWGSSFKEVTHLVSENTSIKFTSFPFSFNVLPIPGHTKDHVAYYVNKMLFCGDTLFSAGCGRLFEGRAAELYSSLLKLNELPDETKIYCAHEYTYNNLRFAHLVEPENVDVLYQLEKVNALDKHTPSLPSTLELEKKINPFLRCHLPQIMKRVEEYANQPLRDNLSVFTWLRKWKDEF